MHHQHGHGDRQETPRLVGFLPGAASATGRSYPFLMMLSSMCGLLLWRQVGAQGSWYAESTGRV